MTMMTVLALAAATVPEGAFFIPVEGWPEPSGDLYLVLAESRAASSVALCDSREPGAATATGWVEYPGLLNSAKSQVCFDPSDGTLTVWSQYPFTADYEVATFALREGELLLLDWESRDYYLEALEEMSAAHVEGDPERVLERAWEVMYPGSNPYPREMCVILLDAGLSLAESASDSGASPEEAIERMEDFEDACMNLSGAGLHEIGGMASPPLDPREDSTMLSEHAASLERYAALLEEAGELERAAAARETVRELTGG